MSKETLTVVYSDNTTEEGFYSVLCALNWGKRLSKKSFVIVDEKGREIVKCSNEK